MNVVIVYIGLAGTVTGQREMVQRGAYLETFNVNAHNGRGSATWTHDLAKAMKFSDSLDAADVWRTQSTVLPTRPDGKPNRPLTAFTVEIRQAR